VKKPPGQSAPMPSSPALSLGEGEQPKCVQIPISIKPEYMVVIGICTHLGCSPSPKLKAGEEAARPIGPHAFLTCLELG
jgi:Rieske Fe-S protein